MTVIAETLDTFRRVREAGNLDAMLETIGANPAAMFEEAAHIAATDASVAEAFIIGSMIARLTSAQENVILFELAPTDPTGSTGRGRGPGRVRPGMRRSR